MNLFKQVSDVDLKNTVSSVNLVKYIWVEWSYYISLTNISNSNSSATREHICLLEDGCRVSGGILSVGCRAFFALNVGCWMKDFCNVGSRNNPFHGS